MATTDCTDMRSPCPCGKGAIVVTQSAPDHPWVRASQIHYSGCLECDDCSKVYVVINGYDLPYLGLRAEVAAIDAAKTASAESDAKFKASAPAQAIIPKIIADIDAQPTKAARHRAIQKYGLSRGSYATFIKRPYGGAEAVKYISGLDLARIGAELGLSGPDIPMFKAKANELEKLMKASWGSPKPIKTGATWMKF